MGPRHCERSEAIHRAARKKAGLLRCARNDNLLDMHIIPAARFARGLLFLPALIEQRAQGKPGARCTRGLACKIVQKSAHEHTGSAEAVRPSLRNGFNGFLRTLPGDRAFLSPSLANESANLTPASRRQDHTTSPSASKTLSSEAPPASIASSPASVTIAIRPSSGVDGCGYRTDLRFRKTRRFLQKGLDTHLFQNDPTGKSLWLERGHAQQRVLHRMQRAARILHLKG